MQIIADADILTLDENFQELGELVKIPGREITRDHLADADALLVRSITPVNEQLLKNTSVKFVGSATSGTDHIDLEYLKTSGIAFSDAGGTNANAVVEYCITALSIIAKNQNLSFTDRKIAIIGAGNVGGLLTRKLVKLGYQCVICDPFLSEQEKRRLLDLHIPSVSFAEAIQADIISLHVPLTRSGHYPTFHLLNADNLPCLTPGCVLLNTSRGAVIDNAAMGETLQYRDDLTVVLDVWESEPDIDSELLNSVFLGTPHIAGYSIEAKYAATRKLKRDFCAFFKQDNCIDLETTGVDNQSVSSTGSVSTLKGNLLDLALLGDLLPLENLTAQFRNLTEDGRAPAASVFDQLRRQLAVRHEFGSMLMNASKFDSQLRVQLEIIGFNFI